MPATVTLRILADGVLTPYHVTVARLVTVGQRSIATFKTMLDSAFTSRYFGPANVYDVTYVEKWGPKSFFIDFGNAAHPSLDVVRTQLFQYLTTFDGVVIEKDRYGATGGLPPQHVATGGVSPPFVTQQITFVLEVKPALK